MLRLAGIDHSTLLRDAGIVFTVRNCDIDYTAPARLDDDIEVHTRILDIFGASIRAEQVVRRGNDSLVRLLLRLACVRDNGRPARLPTSLRDALAALQQTASQQQSEVRA
jgi:acyl-CoA thioester hydrolase